MAFLESKIDHKDLFHKTEDGLAIFTTEGSIVEVNQAFAALHGYTIDEIMALKLQQLDILGDKTLSDRIDISALIEKGESVRFEVEHLHKDGHIFPLEVITSLITIEGKPHLYGVFHDITEQIQAKETLHKYNLEKNLLLNLSQAISSSFDLDFVLQTISDGATQILDIESAAIYLVEENKLYLSTTTPHLPPDMPDLLRRLNPDDHPHIKNSLAKGHPSVLADTHKAELTRFEREIVEIRQLRSLIYLPFKMEEMVEGVLILGTVAKTRDFSEHEIELCRTITNQLSLAIQNIQLHSGLKQRAKDLEIQIAERKLVEQDLRKREMQLANALKMAKAGVWEYDIEDDTFTFNDNFFSIYKTNVTEVESYQMSSAEYAGRFCHPEDMHLVADEIKAIIETDDPNYTNQVEHRILYADGSEGYVAVRFFIIKDQNRKTVKAIGVNQDITERKKIEETLKNNEERYQSFIEKSLEGVFRLEMITPIDISQSSNLQVEDIYRYSAIGEYNQAFADMYEIKPAEMVSGELWADFLEKKGRTLNKEMINGFVESGYRLVRNEITEINSNGEKRIYSINMTGIIVDGYLIRIWETRLDITNLKNAEEENELLTVQLIQAQKLESIGRLAGGVAHDFNNMLSVILGNTELLLFDTEPDFPGRPDLIEIQQAALRSSEIAKQLLAFARKQTVAPKVLEINTVIESTLKMLVRLIGENIDLDWKPGKDIWPIEIDPSQLDQILANLCVNSRDAINGVGKIIIETENVIVDEATYSENAGFIPGEYVMLAISDNGCGMDKETASQIFEPFFTTKEMDHGTGLGLATVYGIIKQNKGSIIVYSEPGKGTTFKIFLPKYGMDGKVSQLVESTSSVRPGIETLLIVEDDRSILRILKKILKRNGYSVISATSPLEAIKLAEEFDGTIDLVMTDVVMPKMNGKDLANTLQKIYPGIKQLFMSGYTADIIAHQGVLENGVNFLPKPFSSRDLFTKIREALD